MTQYQLKRAYEPASPEETGDLTVQAAVCSVRFPT